jgi:restriction system protein
MARSAGHGNEDIKKRPRRFEGRSAHRYWVLRAFEDLGGSATKQEVCRWVLPKMEPEFGPRDREPVRNSPELTWQNEVAWARKDLVGRGLLKSGSPRGVWEITDSGREWLRSHRNPPRLHDPTKIDEIG